MMDRWCQLPFRDFGFTTNGVHGFGAIVFDHRHSYEERFLVEHNLAAFWGKERFPAMSLLPTPIIPSRNLPGILSRLPGQIRHDLPNSQMENRNLLTTKKYGDTVKLWTVNECSDRKLLEEFSLDILPDGSCNVREENRTFPLEDMACQLKKSQIADFMLRRKGGLELWRNGISEVIFRGAVSSYEESPFLAEIVICDKRGFVWFGPPGMPFSRIKNYSGRAVKRVCFSDHPCVLFASSDKEVRLLDLRGDTEATAISLFSLTDFDARKEFEVSTIPNGLFDSPRFYHLMEVPDCQQYCLAISSRFTHVIDSRWSGRPVTSLAHGFHEGGDYILPELPFKDSDNDGTIYQYHFLNHNPPSVKTLSLYHHSGGLWSTLGPVKRMSEPVDYLNIIKESTVKNDAFLISPTRSISLIEGLEDTQGCRMDVFVRALDDGSIWSEKILFKEITDEEHGNLIERDICTMREYLEKKRTKPPIWGEDIPDELLEDERHVCRLINFEMDVDESVTLSWEKEVLPMKMKADKKKEVLSTMTVTEEKREISCLIQDTWKRFALPPARKIADKPKMLEFEEDD